MTEPKPTDLTERTIPSLSGKPAPLRGVEAPTTVIAPEAALSEAEGAKPAAEAPTLKDGRDRTRQQGADAPDLPIDLRRGDMPTVPGYALTDKLGEGTYGVVWRAVEGNTGKTVAIKFFHMKVGELWQLVWAEVKQLALLDAVQGIVQLKDAHPDAEPPYFIMNYAEGGSLAARIRRGRLSASEALVVMRHIAEALSYVHAKGIRHCDLKPANILLDVMGRPLIADFGQAHLSLSSQGISGNLGTFFYMAPDQADLEKQIPDTRWDVYALGAIFYCMVTGVPPRASATLMEELNNTAHLHTRLSRYRQGVAAAPSPRAHHALPGMDRSLANIIDKCLELDPTKRYQSASEVLHALNQRDRFRRQRPLLLLGMAATFLLILGLGGFAWSMLHTAVAASKEALVEQVTQSDQTAVNMMANVVADKLDGLLTTVENVAKKEDYVATFQTLLREVNAASIADTSYRSSKACREAQKTLDTIFRPNIRTWVLYDTRGHLLVASHVVRRNPRAADLAERERYMKKFEAIYGKSFGYRDYIHGQAGDRRDEKLPYKAKLFVSEPYESTLEVDGRRAINMGISAPLYPLDAAGEPDRSAPPFGVLVGFIDVERDLANWLSGVSFNKGSAILLNHHGQCVFHSSAGRGELFRRDEGFLRKRADVLEIVGQAKEGKQFDLGPDRNLCLPSQAFLPPKNAERDWQPDHWVALIVHDQEKVFGQVEQLQRRLSLIIILGGGVLLLTVAGLWAWLLKSLRGDVVR